MKSLVLLIAVATVATAFYTGVNEAGLEFGNANTDAYQQPYMASIQYFKSSGANIIRVPFRWDRLMNTASDGSLNQYYLGLIKGTVAKVTSLGMVAILDLHNYARFGQVTQGPVFPDFDYDTKLIGKPGGPTLANFQNVWNLLAAVPDFKSNNLVWFGLINEPAGYHDTTVPKDTGCQCYTQLVKGSFTPMDNIRMANAGIAGIRATGANNKILVSGTVWTGIHSWFDSTWYSLQGSSAETASNFPSGVLSNAQAFEPSTGSTGIKDSGNNWALEVHTYLDSGQSGTQGDCVTYNTDWLNRLSTWAAGGAVDLSNVTPNAQYGSATPANPNRKIDLFLGEFGFQDDSATNNKCPTEAAKVFNHLTANKIENGGRWLGFTFWAAGPMWDGSNTGYKYLVEPQWYFKDGSSGKCNPDVNSCNNNERSLFLKYVKPQFVGTTSSSSTTGSSTSASGTTTGSSTTGSSTTGSSSTGSSTTGSSTTGSGGGSAGCIADWAQCGTNAPFDGAYASSASAGCCTQPGYQGVGVQKGCSQPGGVGYWQCKPF